MLLDNFYIFSSQGDILLSRSFIQNNTKHTLLPETLFNDYLFNKSNIAPVIVILLKDHTHDHIFFAHIKKHDMFFALTTFRHLPPSYLIELLCRIASVFKDFFGVLSEESILKNFLLAYELLDEMIDFGYPQSTLSSVLKDRIHSFPVPPNDFHYHPVNKTLPSTASQRPIVIKPSDILPRNLSLRNSLHVFTPQTLTREYVEEVFVDVVERLSVMQTGAGNVEYATLEGSIIVKNFLKASPLLRLVLSNHLVSIPFEEILFGNFVNYENYVTKQTLEFSPPEGESRIMNYTTLNTRIFKIPLNVSCSIDFVSKGQIKLNISIACLLLHNIAGPLNAICPLQFKPSEVSIHTNNVGKQVAEYDSMGNCLRWKIEGLVFEATAVLTCLISINNFSISNTSIKKQIGPIVLNYEIPMYSASSLGILQLTVNSLPNPPRWIRYVCRSNSHIYHF